MKLITCMIQPGKLPEVKQALFDAQVNRMTVFNALGAGQQGGHKETYRGVQYEINLLKKVRLDIAVKKTSSRPPSKRSSVPPARAPSATARSS